MASTTREGRSRGDTGRKGAPTALLPGALNLHPGHKGEGWSQRACPLWFQVIVDLVSGKMVIRWS